jgi:hypothetical protein
MRKFSLDALVDACLGKFGGNADTVINCPLIRRSVSNDADAAYTQQRGAAVF